VDLDEGLASVSVGRVALADGTSEENDPKSASRLVVVDEVGDPLAPQVYSDRFRRQCAAAGVPTIKLHNVRHSLAFWLHQLGVAPADAAALLGHSVEVHLSTYLPHSGAAGIRAAARALGAGMAQQQEAVASGLS